MALQLCQEQILVDHLKEKYITLVLSKGDLFSTTRLILHQKCLLIVLVHQSYLKVSKRDAFREENCIILTLSEVAGEVPLEAGAIIRCLAIDCKTPIRGAYPNEIFIAYLRLYFISNVLKFLEIALAKNLTLTLDLKFEQIQSAIDQENPVYLVFPLFQVIIVVVVGFNVICIQRIHFKR